jgi:hypothetical protein
MRALPVSLFDLIASKRRPARLDADREHQQKTDKRVKGGSYVE